MACINGFAQNVPPVNLTPAGRQQTVEAAWQLISKYNPEGKYILENQARRYSTTAEALISKWYFEERDDNVFMDLGVAVHEEYHGFQTGGFSTFKTFKELVNNQPVTLNIPSDAIVKSEEIHSRVENSFRKETYLSRGNRNSANVDGAYGLLREFSAYYYTLKATIDCHDYVLEYLDKYGYSDKAVTDYFKAIPSRRLAFYEFKYWTLEYLLYLRERYSDNYRTIMNDQVYKSTFLYFHDKFQNLVEQVTPKNTDIFFEKLQTMGINARITTNNAGDGVYMFGSWGSLGNFSNEIEKTRILASAEKYNSIMTDFRGSAQSGNRQTPQPTPPGITPTPSPTPSSPPAQTPATTTPAPRQTPMTLSSSLAPIENPLVRDLATCQTYEQFRRTADGYRRQGKLIYGSNKTSFVYPHRCFIAVFSPDQRLIALLDTGDGARTDLLTGNTIQNSEQHFRGNYLFWIQIN